MYFKYISLFLAFGCAYYVCFIGNIYLVTYSTIFTETKHCSKYKKHLTIDLMIVSS